MIVYRLCRKDEAKKILVDRTLEDIGQKMQIDPKKNTHQYIQDENYIHFFENLTSILYLNTSEGKVICEYDIPEDILNQTIGTGDYLDYIYYKDLDTVTEYAIESNKVKFEYLKKMYQIKEDFEFDYIPTEDEISDKLSLMYDAELLEKIFAGDNVVDGINNNIDALTMLIPEIKFSMGFEHKHPHHHLDVWNHTLEVLKNLNTKDFELNMAALLHDIGKPFSYQDEEVRHFHGHPQASSKMAEQILTRLGYDQQVKDRIIYLVETHDTIIDPKNLDNKFELVEKRLQLQYADAKSHHPDKVDKRIKALDQIKKQLDDLDYTDR